MFAFLFRFFDKDAKSSMALAQSILDYALKPEIFAATRLSNDLDGRFESLAAHAAVPLSIKGLFKRKTVTHAYLHALKKIIEDGLREDGVSDMRIDRQMTARLEGLYGRLQTYADLLREPDPTLLNSACARNGLESHYEEDGKALAQSMRNLRQALMQGERL